MVFLGVTSAIAIMVLLYVFSMAGYFAVRKRNASAKYLVEVMTVLLAFALSFIVKATILLINDHETFSDGFNSILQAHYFTIGGLAFDGIEMGVAGMSFINCLYSGTSFYAGAIFLSVVTAKASYDVYSGIRIMLLRFSKKMKQSEIDVYFFTSVSEDSLLLAKSISRHYEQAKNTDKNAKDYVIIFTGEELESFDRQNPLHNEIMAEGYYYWPYGVNGIEQPKSLLKRFGLRPDNDFVKNSKPVSSVGRIHVFAFANNATLSGNESVNSGKIFTEIKTLTVEYLTGKNKTFSIVDFYLLTDGAINYQLYEGAVKQSVLEGVKLSGVKVEDDQLKKLTNFYFQLHVINEADISGKCLTEKRNALYSEEFEKTKINLFEKDACGYENKPYRTLIVGFGRTGQCSLTELCSNLAYVDKNKNAKAFYADVYDPEMQNQAGIYSLLHPMCVTVDLGERVQGVEQKDITENHYQRINWMYENSGLDFETVKKQMCFPVIAFHSYSCFDYKFTGYLNQQTADENDGKTLNKSRYNAFIVSLGNDENNIRFANALIDDLKRTSKTICEGFGLQVVYVNVRDEKNYSRIPWSESDSENFKNLKVIVYGNREDIYSYSRIIDETSEIIHNNVYNRLFEEKRDEKQKNQTQSTQNSVELSPIAMMKQAIIKQDKTNYAKAMDEILSKVKNYSENSATDEWLNLDIWRKQSNGAAKRLKPAYECYYKAGNDYTGENIAFLAYIEHERWCRYYIMNGWGYYNYEKRDKEFYQRNRYHRCLCPASALSVDTLLYDLGNLLLAKKDAE